jgi:hypothetical protein
MSSKDFGHRGLGGPSLLLGLKQPGVSHPEIGEGDMLVSVQVVWRRVGRRKRRRKVDWDQLPDSMARPERDRDRSHGRYLSLSLYAKDQDPLHPYSPRPIVHLAQRGTAFSRRYTIDVRARYSLERGQAT